MPRETSSSSIPRRHSGGQGPCNRGCLAGSPSSWHSPLPSICSRRLFSGFSMPGAPASNCGRSRVVAVRVNPRRNIVAADAASPECLRELLAITELNEIHVTTREPADRRISIGFVYGVDADLTNTELLRGIVSATPVTAVTKEEAL
ncbi:hypothetical protein MRX96_043069 [Rhipicephalus microplus]